MKNATSKMTLEKLATMVANGFAHIEEKMATKEEMNAGFKKVDQRFEEVDQKFKQVEKSIQTIRGDILKQGDHFVSQETFNSRISTLEAKVKLKIK